MATKSMRWEGNITEDVVTSKADAACFVHDDRVATGGSETGVESETIGTGLCVVRGPRLHLT